MITYDDKDKNGASPDNLWTDYNANEVKTEINRLYTQAGIGVFAYLVTPTMTDIVTANTYTIINGEFANSPAIGFDFVADPAIQYTGSETMYFEIDAHASFSVEKNNTTVRCAVKKNGTLVTPSIVSSFAKTLGEYYNISGTSVVEMVTGDKIQLVISCDIISDVTFQNIVTTIRPFII